MSQFFVIYIKISAVYFNLFFTTAKQYCLPIRTCICTAKMNQTEPVKRLKFGFIFYAQNMGSNHKMHRNQDLKPQYLFLYDLILYSLY